MEEEEAAVLAVVPAGFRFLPTDWETLNYLREERMTAESMRLGFIRYIDLYAVEPWKLWEWFSSRINDDHHIVHGGGGDDQEEDYCEYQDYLYFYTPLKKKTKNGTNIDRTVVVNKGGGGAEGQGSSVTVGTWKPQSKPINIIDSRTGMPMGVKKQMTFVPSTKMEDNEDGCSSKKRKHTPEEMELGISYIMHEYTLCPSDNQVYSLCRIRRKIDKKIIINKKKMRRSSSPTTNTTTTTYSTSTVVVQADQEERDAGYDHHQQENNNICYNDGQQQQEAVLPPEGDVQISNGDKGLANAMEADIVFHSEVLNEEFLSRLEQDVAARAATTGGHWSYYDNDHQEVMNTAGVSEINVHPHVQTSDDDKRPAQEIEEELTAEWRQGATAEELGFFNIEDLLRSCH